MYGKQAAENDRESIRAGKRQQLSTLLVNKFRNKYAVNGSNDGVLDKLIQDEVSKLLSEGTAHESALQRVDKKLEAVVKHARERQNDSKQQSVKGSNRTELRQDDAKSQRSMRSSRSNYSKVSLSAHNQLDKKRVTVYHVDPAEQLIPTDEEWNNIVQQNLQKFKEDKVRVVQERIEKNQKVQVEQRKQWADRIEKDQKAIKEDREFFQTIGHTASDKFYINHDRRKDMEAQRRGLSKGQATEINSVFTKHQSENRDRMQVMAAERRNQLQKMQNEDQEKKQHEVERKQKLRKIQDEDKHHKDEFRDRNATHKSQDFQPVTILSYVYDVKPKKADEYKKRNDQIYNIMKNQFLDNSSAAQLKELEIIKRDEAQKNQKFDLTVEKQRADRRLKELETKKFQDRQVAEKQRVKLLEVSAKQQEYAVCNEKAATFKEEIAKKQNDRRARNVDHVNQVLDQMKEQPRTFAKTGIAVIKS